MLTFVPAVLGLRLPGQNTGHRVELTLWSRTFVKIREYEEHVNAKKVEAEMKVVNRVVSGSYLLLPRSMSDLRMYE